MDPNEATSDPELDEEDPQSSDFDVEAALESVVRITLAGLGGSMLGLSQERKLESMRVVTRAAATAAARRKRNPAERQANLPLQWAISTMAFCTIVETSRRLQLSRRTLDALGIYEEGANGQSLSLQTFGGTVADYTLGGGVGGLAASMGRNTHLRKQLPSSMLRGSQRFFGVVPGLTLGFVAGAFQAVTDAGISYLEHKQKEQEAEA